MKAQNTPKESVQTESKPSTESQLTVVKFNHTKIQCTIDPDGTIFVGIRPICESIGIDTKKAVLAMKDDSILGAKVTERYLLDAKKRRLAKVSILTDIWLTLC